MSGTASRSGGHGFPSCRTASKRKGIPCGGWNFWQAAKKKGQSPPILLGFGPTGGGARRESAGMPVF